MTVFVVWIEIHVVPYKHHVGPIIPHRKKKKTLTLTPLPPPLPPEWSHHLLKPHGKTQIHSHVFNTTISHFDIFGSNFED